MECLAFRRGSSHSGVLGETHFFPGFWEACRQVQQEQGCCTPCSQESPGPSLPQVLAPLHHRRGKLQPPLGEQPCVGSTCAFLARSSQWVPKEVWGRCRGKQRRPGGVGERASLMGEAGAQDSHPYKLQCTGGGGRSVQGLGNFQACVSPIKCSLMPPGVHSPPASQCYSKRVAQPLPNFPAAPLPLQPGRAQGRSHKPLDSECRRRRQGRILAACRASPTPQGCEGN